MRVFAKVSSVKPASDAASPAPTRGEITYSSRSQHLNALPPSSMQAAGTWISVILLQFRKACAPIFVTPSGIRSSRKFRHLPEEGTPPKPGDRGRDRKLLE